MAAPEPLIDVILPGYNGRDVIRAAIDSALGQDVPLRLIVVDDGSKDDTGDIARAYGPPVTVITQANRGVSGARNTGLAAARAPYVALLDQDDIWAPGKLARQLALLEQRPEVGLVFTDMLLLQPDGTVVEDGFLLTTPPYAELRREPVGDGAYLLPADLADAVTRFNFISPSTVLMRRDAVQGVGGFDEAFRLCDDAECWMRLLSRWRGIAIEENLVRSLVWEGNASLKRDKLIWERIRIGEKVAAHPELFSLGAPEYLGRERSVSYYRLGVLALQDGDARSARGHFATSFQGKPCFTTALGLAATLVPAGLRARLMDVKRRANLAWSIEVK